jgi:hypothetical protein
LREAVEALGGELLPYSDDEPLWMLDTAGHIDRALHVASALLSRQERACRSLQLLPRGYSPDQADFSEFFTPESVLKMAEAAPEWGLLEDPEGGSLAGHLADAINTAQALLAGMLPLAESLGISVQYRPGLDLPNLCYLFQAEALLQDYSREGRRWLRVPPGALADDEEGLASASSLTAHGLELASRALNEAASAALRLLVEFAEGESSEGPAPRLGARLCVALREELAELVAEWVALERAQEVV